MKITNDVQTRETALVKAQTLLEERDAEIHKLREQIEGDKHRAEQIQEANVRLENDKDSTVRAKDAEIRAIKLQLETVKSDSEKQIQQLRDVGAKLGRDKDEEIRVIKLRLETAEGDSAKVIQQLRNAGAQLESDKNATIRAKDEEIREIKMQSETKIQILKDQVKSDSENHIQQIEDVKARLESDKASAIHLQDEKISELTAKLQEHKVELERLERQLDTSGNEILQLRAEVEDASEENEDRSELKSALDRAEAENRELLAKSQTQVEVSNRVREELDGLRGEKDVLMAELKQTKVSTPILMIVWIQITH
ncbi:hypothetical protein F5878DRAFT_668166 [Lentinula raphanica]|uniref:Uncharacterized protein n=1 Tax=Lentinula raphanica TaxID=153919 RepID=A0AA38NUL0_9AGAR|nr:hypothetical protein F5878DRAFT_668166 [Lentinula raphanica]